MYEDYVPFFKKTMLLRDFFSSLYGHPCDEKYAQEAVENQDLLDKTIPPDVIIRRGDFGLELCWLTEEMLDAMPLDAECLEFNLEDYKP